MSCFSFLERKMDNLHAKSTQAVLTGISLDVDRFVSIKISEGCVEESVAYPCFQLLKG